MSSIATAIARNTISSLPPFRQIRQRRLIHRGYDAGKDTAAYTLGVFEKHRDAIEQVRPLAGASVLEIGPGGNLAVAALMVKHGATDATCIDVFPWNAERGDLYAALGVADVVHGIEYRCPDGIETTELPDRRFDIIFSHACFEHFRHPGRAVQSISRLLRPGGVTTHQIDLRDHRDFSRPHDFLRYRDATWLMATRGRTSFTNRWRLSDYHRSFTAAGLDVIHAEPTAVADPPPDLGIAPRFHDATADDISTLGVFLVAAQRRS